MSLHKEGTVILTVSAILFLIIGFSIAYFLPEQELVLYVAASVMAMIYIWFLWFFRIPGINVNKDSNTILASADGKVVVVEKAFEGEYLKEDRIQVSVFMSPLNVHQNRTPIGGVFKYIKYHPGKFLVAWHPKSSTENERTTFVMEQGNLQVLFRQIAGIMARRIKWYVKEGSKLDQGDEFGFIRFGSRVDTFIPLDASIKVKVGDSVKAGKTILAELKK